MGFSKTLKVSDAVAWERYSALRFHIAGKINRLPTTSELIRALSQIGENHSDEVIAAISEAEREE